MAAAKQMIVVQIRTTGHIVGALTRNGSPDLAPKPEELLPEGLEIHDPATGTLRFRVPPSALDVKPVELVPDALLRPLAYAVVDNKATLLTQAALALPASPATATGVTVPVRSPGKQKIWVLLQPVQGGEPLQNGKEAPEVAADTNVTVDFAIPAGDYRLIVWVEGSLPATDDTVTV